MDKQNYFLPYPKSSKQLWDHTKFDTNSYGKTKLHSTKFKTQSLELPMRVFEDPLNNVLHKQVLNYFRINYPFVKQN